MPQSLHKQLNVMTLVRIAAIVVAFMLGHDAMMAMTPHNSAGAETVDVHHGFVVERCGPTEGMPQHPAMPPAVYSSGVLTGSGWHIWLDANSDFEPSGSAYALDGQALRTLLQVFLN